MLGMASNGFYDDIPECPLCLEPLGLDDINFYPCACRYQICRFCWHRIRTDENGLCPHCREIYPENPAEYTPPTQEQLAKTKSDKKQKEQCKRQKVVESREKLASVRVVQRNLVFAIGLSPRLADPEVLKRNEYFGKYGKIYKVVINNHTIYNGAQGPSVSAYVTYCRNEDASKAIAAVNNAFIDGRSLKASFGTTKYCTSFLKGTLCTKPDCMYLHELGEDEASFTKEDMQLGKHQIFESATLASLLPPGTVKEPPPPLPPSAPPSAPSAPSAAEVDGEVMMMATMVPPQTLKEPIQLDVAESALPVTAHWASNQKVQSSDGDGSDGDGGGCGGEGDGGGGGGGNGELSGPDLSNSSLYHSTKPSSSHAHSPTSMLRTEHSTSPHSRQHTGTTTAKRIPMEISDKQHDPMKQDGPRSGSTSPNNRIPDQLVTKRQSSREQQERESSRTNQPPHQGFSLTKSALSPRGNLSASSSSGSFRQQDTDDATSTRGPGVTAVQGRSSSGSSEAGLTTGITTAVPRKRGPLSEDLIDVGISFGSVMIGKGDMEDMTSSPESNRAQLFEGEKTTITTTTTGDKSRHTIPHSKPVVMRDGVAYSSSNPPPISIVGHHHHHHHNPHHHHHPLPISSPPGLSKTKPAQHVEPLTLATQSDRVCRELKLHTTTNNPSSLMGLRMTGDRSVFGGGAAAERTMVEQTPQEKKDGVRTEGDPSSHMTFMQNDPVRNNVITSLTYAGNSHFGSLGVNWNNPPTTSRSALLNSAPSPLPAPGSLVHPPQHPPASHERTPYPPKSNKCTEQVDDDGDDLGFDPWDVSQQGLADLLESEAEQQRKPHPFGAIPDRRHSKGGPNGINSFVGHDTPLYRNWQGHTSSHSTMLSAGSASRDIPTESDSLRDEFRALFPNVNISFGGTGSKQPNSEKPSSLGQALDASTPSTSTYLPTHLATALNYSYHAPSSSSYRPSVPPQGHTHLPASKQGAYPSYSDGANLFLGQSQPGFPASSFRVKGSNSGMSSTTTSSGPIAATTASVTAPDVASRGTAPPGGGGGRSTYSNCLGPDWPDLGIAVGQITKLQNQSQSVPVTSSSSSSSLGKNRSGDVSLSTTSSATSSALPSPPPGFSKTTPLTGRSHLDGTASRGVTAAGNGNGNQTTTTANPMLMANSKGQILPNHLLQSWTNYRNLANLTPAQQQQLARNNQITYQQLLAQQYLFQQAMLRNPLLQAQSLRMAQLHQQALLQQQQQAAMAAGLASGGVSNAGSMKATQSMSTSSAALSNSKLPAGDVSFVSDSNSTLSPSVSVAQSGATAGNLTATSVFSNKSTSSSGPGTAKTSSQNGANNGLKGHVHSTIGVSGGGNGGRGSGNIYPSSSSVISSKTTTIPSQITTTSTGNLGSNILLSGGGSSNDRPYPSLSSSSSSSSSSRASKLPAKPKIGSGGGGHATNTSSVNMDKKSRQKSK